MHFANDVNYHSYRAVNRSQRYNEMLAARTSKYVKQIESMKRFCVLDDKDLITISMFLDEFKWLRKLNGVSEKWRCGFLPTSYIKARARALKT